MKSEAKANESLAQAVEAFQSEQAAWGRVLGQATSVKKLAAPVKVVRPVSKPVKVGLFNRLFSFN